MWMTAAFEEYAIVAGDPGDRRDMDDIAARLFNERHRGAARPHRRLDIDRHHLAPMRQIDIGDTAERADPGVVDQDVDYAEAVGDGGDQCFDFRGDQHVDPMTDETVAAQRGGERIDRIGTNIGDDDCCPLIVKPPHRGLADPRRAAGDDRDLAIEPPAHRAVYPPSTVSSAPLTKAARSLSSQHAACPTSSG